MKVKLDYAAFAECDANRVYKELVLQNFSVNGEAEVFEMKNGRARISGKPNSRSLAAPWVDLEYLLPA